MSSAVTRRSVTRSEAQEQSQHKKANLKARQPRQKGAPKKKMDAAESIGDRTRSHDLPLPIDDSLNVDEPEIASATKNNKRKRAETHLNQRSGDLQCRKDLNVCDKQNDDDDEDINRCENWPKRRRIVLSRARGRSSVQLDNIAKTAVVTTAPRKEEIRQEDSGSKRQSKKAPAKRATKASSIATAKEKNEPRNSRKRNDFSPVDKAAAAGARPIQEDRIFTPDNEILAALIADETDEDGDKEQICVGRGDDREAIVPTRRIDYMVAANPVGKPRVVGAPKRNRKEQMAIQDQIRAGKDLAKSFGVVQLGNESAAESDQLVSDSAGEHCDEPHPPPPPPDMCVDGNTSSSAAEQEKTRANSNANSSANSNAARRRGPIKRPSFMRSLRNEEKERIARNDALKKFGPLRVMRQDRADGGEREAQDSDDDDDQDAELPDAESAIIKRTSSDMLKPYDYSSWDNTQEYEDEHFSEYASDAQTLSENAIKDYAARIVDSGAEFTEEQRLDMARAFFDNCGYGVSAVTMEDFDITRVRSDDHAASKHMHEASGDATKNCRYPTRSNLCCRYDHQRFDGIPILMPLCYHADKNILEVLPNMVFCSFACLLAYVNREMPRMHSNVRADRVSLVRFMARKWFGITEKIRMAPFLEQHRKYGGRLSTRQFRALSQTHYSFVQYPLAVAVPARYITEIFVSRKIDRAKRQGLNLRVSEQHGNQLPEMPLALEIDPSAPAAPRGAEARARATKAKEARQKKLGTAGAAGTNKKRVAVAPDGTRKTIDRAYVENVIRKTAEQQKKRPKKKHALEAMLGIKSVTCGDFLSSGHEDEAT